MGDRSIKIIIDTATPLPTSQDSPADPNITTTKKRRSITISITCKQVYLSSICSWIDHFAVLIAMDAAIRQKKGVVRWRDCKVFALPP